MRIQLKIIIKVLKNEISLMVIFILNLKPRRSGINKVTYTINTKYISNY
jgi:hypothetical protein